MGLLLDNMWDNMWDNIGHGSAGKAEKIKICEIIICSSPMNLTIRWVCGKH